MSVSGIYTMFREGGQAGSGPVQGCSGRGLQGVQDGSGRCCKALWQGFIQRRGFALGDAFESLSRACMAYQKAQEGLRGAGCAVRGTEGVAHKGCIINC